MGAKQDDPGLVNSVLGLLKESGNYSEESYQHFYSKVTDMSLDTEDTLQRVVDEINGSAFEYHPEQHLFAARCAVELQDESKLRDFLHDAYAADDDFELAIIAANHINLRRKERLVYANFIFSYDPGEALKHYLTAKRMIGFNRDITQILEHRFRQLCDDYYPLLLNEDGSELANKTLKYIVQYAQSLGKKQALSEFLLHRVLEAKSIPYLTDLYAVAEEFAVEEHKTALWSRYMKQIESLLPDCKSIHDLYLLPNITKNYTEWNPKLSPEQQEKFYDWGELTCADPGLDDKLVSALCYRLAGKGDGELETIFVQRKRGAPHGTGAGTF